MSSSRSIAAARNRRAGDPPAQPQGQQQRRPNTSIGGNAAFAPQPALQRNNNIRGPPPPQQQQFQQQQFQQQQFQQQQFQQQQFQQQQFQQQQFQQQQQQQQSNQKKVVLGSQIPSSTKLSVSDAIGLITLRLGSVEQYIIDLQGQDKNNSDTPSNMTMIDTSILTSIINRLDSLEKKESTSSNEVSKLKEEWNPILVDHENKITDLLNTVFVTEEQGQEINNEFLENLENVNISDVYENDANIDNNNDANIDNNNDQNTISYDLKNIVNQELANIE
jgi:hypothetical protein